MNQHIFIEYFGIAQGEIISPKVENETISELPKSIEDVINVNSENKKREHKKYYDIKEMANIEMDKDDKTQITQLAGNYNAISYLPQVIGVKIGMIFNLNPYYSAMLGRIFGFITTISIFAFGIYKLPNHKLFATIVLLSPVVLSYAASISADNMTLACIFMLISYIMHFIQTKKKIKIYEYVILSILAGVVAILKTAYLPIIGILLLIPVECFKNKKHKWIIIILLLIFGIALSLLWMKICNINVTEGNQETTNAWIYSKPLVYLTVLFRTTAQNIYSFAENMFAGYYLCHNQVNPYSIVPLSYIIITICAFFKDKYKENISIWQKIIVTGIIFVVYALICTAMYIYNTEYKASVIIGVQGRYLLPILMLVIFFGNCKKVEIKENRLVNIALIANYAVYLTMFTKFFI